MKCQQVGTVLIGFLLVILMATFVEAGIYPMVVADAVGHEVQITHKPCRVVCLAAYIIARNREQLALVKARLVGLKDEQRKRVARVMVGKTLTCPGDDSFQVEMIEAAGGISLMPGKDGFAAPVSMEQWRQFNPQIVYGCSQNEKAVRSAVQREGWNTVSAVRTGFVTMFPCELTCRASVRTGAFVQWLAAVFYPELMADAQKAVLEKAVLDHTSLAVCLPYVAEACKVRHRVADAEYKSLCIRFSQPMDVLSTLEGWRTGVLAVGNTYTPMHASLGHMANGIDGVRIAIAANLGFKSQVFAGLMTGADMDNLSVQERQAGDLRVAAFVTAGVRGNALRLSKDTAGYAKHGTINIILLTNRQLSPQAMSWAVVTITEAKAAALIDLDIRSTYTPLRHGATGTGTDTVIVAQGTGKVANSTSGHTKLGELIAKAVYAGVTEAIAKQNGIRADRSLLHRLAERKLRVEDIVRLYADHAGVSVSVRALEEVLMTSTYAAFIESVLAISDAHGKGLFKDLDFFNRQCELVANRLSGRADTALFEAAIPEMPFVLSKAFGALIAGIAQQKE